MHARLGIIGMGVLFCTLGFFSAFCPDPLSGETHNWNLWKGPRLNGISDESGWDTGFLTRSLKTKWKRNIGLGYSNVSLNDDYLYTIGLDKPSFTNTLYCLNAWTGQIVWKHSYTIGKLTDRYYFGPRSTPVIYEGRVYSLSQDGQFICNDALTGKLLWNRQVVQEFDTVMPRWMFASSVHIEGDKAVINASSSGLAVNRETGWIVWKSQKGIGNYSSPVPFRNKGINYLLIFGQNSLFCVEAGSGKTAWSYYWETTNDVMAADPILYKDTIFITSGYNNGCALIDAAENSPVALWRNKNLSAHFATPIIIGDYLYGIDGDNENTRLVCLDLKDGSLRWRSPRQGFKNMTSADGFLITITQTGFLQITKADPDTYARLPGSKKALDRDCFTAPVIYRSMLYIRNSKGDLLCINLEEGTGSRGWFLLFGSILIIILILSGKAVFNAVKKRALLEAGNNPGTGSGVQG